MTEQAIVVIPARGGSKRFPRKNIALLDGKPLLSYAVRASKAAQKVGDIYVSTEDPEIAAVAEQYGAKVPYLRPAALSGDDVTADDVVRNLVQFLQDQEGMGDAIVVLIQPTSPFVKPEHIDAAIDLFAQDPALDSVTTMSQLDHRKHPYNLSFIGEGGRWEFMFPEEREAARSRQSKPGAQMFCNLFAAKASTFLAKGRFGAVKGSVLIDDVYAWDIDFEWQLVVAEMMMKKGLVDMGY
jgi:CMP-N,N'-diacetyllegionaminic acid synthase